MEEDADYKDFLKEVANVEKEVEQFKESEGARLLGGMLDKGGEYMLFAHEAGASADSRKKGGNFRNAARKKGLEAELAQIWQDTLKTPALKQDRVFAPWFRFAAIPEKEFAEKGHEVAAEVTAAKDTEVHPLIAKAFSEKQPNSLSEVAAIYTEVFGKLREEMKLKPFTARRTARYNADEVKPLADAGLESLRQHLFAQTSVAKPDDARMQRALGNQFTNPAEAIRAKIVRLQLVHPGSPARAMAIEDAPKARDSVVFIRGEPGNRGPHVPRQFPEILAGDARKPFTNGSGRLELAQAIVAPRRTRSPRASSRTACGNGTSARPSSAPSAISAPAPSRPRILSCSITSPPRSWKTAGRSRSCTR